MTIKTTMTMMKQSNAKHAYPRPQLVRDHWESLNGTWDFAIDDDACFKLPSDVTFDSTITVPFAPETEASGVYNMGFYRACWYRRTLQAPELGPEDRLILHFGAVDYAATIWVNETIVMRHRGGYTPFKADITPFLKSGGAQTVVVRAEDDPHDLAKPRGKQDWQLNPHSIWYPRTTGIWQTVWLERVPATAIKSLRWSSNLEHWEIGLEAHVEGKPRDDLRLRVKLQVGDTLIADDTYKVIAGEVDRRIALSDPGIDDYRNELLWSPERPTIIEAELELWGQRGELLDSVKSYTAIRSVTTQGDRFVLNGRPYPLRLVLDQGYWLESGVTAPDDDALRRDVELAKAMGFNGVRKHQKIEDPRYLYWADRLGLLVWEEMPSAYRFTARSIERLTREWMEALERDFSHPCIIAWVPFNESWGVPDLPSMVEQRHAVQSLYHLTKTLDPTRPVIGNDGWESVATDIIGIHDYDHNPERIARRYESAENIPHLFKRERPGGRLLMLEGHPHTGQPIMLTEFGGIAYSEDQSGTWGYSRSHSAREFARSYAELLEVVRTLPLLAGFCYTQFADTYQEANGLLYADRTPKFPLEQIRMATKAPRNQEEERHERKWRGRLLSLVDQKEGS
jgi:beta-galactosidase/beta-glucuronidase